MMINYGLPAITSLFILLLYWFLPALKQASLPFGVRVPPDHEHDPAIAREVRHYRSGLVLIAIVVGAGSLLLGELYPPFIINTGATLLTLVLATLNHQIAHQHIAELKTREGWYAGQRQAVAVDTAGRTEQAPFPLLWFMPSLVLLAAMIITAFLRYPSLPDTIPIHFGMNGEPNGWANKMPGTFTLVVLALLLTILLGALAWYMPRTRQQLNPAQPEASKIAQRVQRQGVTRVILLCSAFSNASFFLAALMSWQLLPTNGTSRLLAVLVPLVLLPAILFVLLVYSKRGTAQAQRVPKQDTGYVYRDDDQYWHGGLYYANPDDPTLWVEKRIGIGWTINFAHPQAKWLVIGFFVFIILVTALPIALK